MQLQEQYPNNVHVISLNVDFDGTSEHPSDDLQSKVAEILVKHDITSDNLLCSDAMEDVLEEFEIFGLPAVLIYDQGGTLYQRFDGKVDYTERVIPTVAKLLGG